MTAMNATRLMDRIGMTLISAALLAGLPLAAITILTQAL